MKKLLTIFSVCTILLSVSCSSYTTKIEDKKSDLLKGIKNAGIIVRVSKNNKITREGYEKNISSWLASMKPIKKITILQQVSEAIGAYFSDEDRFYQISDSGDFLKYKSSGVLNIYLRNNESELKKIITEKNLDGLIFYEIYSIVSFEMQYSEFESMVCIVDKNLNVAFRDYQANTFNNEEINQEKMKIELLDKISSRFMETLTDLDFIKK
jgi:hypothetical protein